MYENNPLSYSRVSVAPRHANVVAMHNHSPRLDHHSLHDIKSSYRSPDNKYRDYTVNSYQSSRNNDGLQISPREGLYSSRRSPNRSNLNDELHSARSEARYGRLSTSRSVYESRGVETSNVSNRYHKSPEQYPDFQGKTYSHEYVEQLKSRHNNEMREFEEKYKLLCLEYDDFKLQMTENITSLNRQLERESTRHLAQLEQIRMDINYEAEEKMQAYEYEIKSLHNRIKEQEQEIKSFYRKLQYSEDQSRALDQTTKGVITDLRIQTDRVEISRERERDQYENRIQSLIHEQEVEKRRIQESNNKLVAELSLEIKQLCDKMTEEMHIKEDRIIELERRVNTSRADLKSESTVGADHQTDINFLRRLVDENNEEIERLSLELEDKKAHIIFLQSKMELMKPERVTRDKSTNGDNGRSSFSRRAPRSPSRTEAGTYSKYI